MATYLDTTILFVAFPGITASFEGSSASTLSWVLNAYTIAFAALLVPAGKLADRLGQRLAFLVGSATFSVWHHWLAGLPRRPDFLIFCPRRPRRRRRDPGPGFARAGDGGVPARQSSRTSSPSGVRSARCRRRSAHRSAR